MKEKKKYKAPEIVKIELDNEISLALESEPPIGPEEGAKLTPEYLKNDPFRAESV